MPATYAERLQIAVASIEAELAKLMAIVEGNAASSPVATTGGPVKTIAKIIEEGQALIASAVGSEISAATAAATAAAASSTAAGTSATASETARVAAVAAKNAAETASTAAVAAAAAVASANTQQTLVDGATINWNIALGGAAKVTLAGNRTIANPTNKANGTTYMLEVIQDATGNRTLTWGSDFIWPANTPPALTSVPGRRDFISFFCTEGKMCGSIVSNYAVA